MTRKERADIADCANDAARGSRRGGAPWLTADSSRDAVIGWLQWNDPNGSHTDSLARREGGDPYDFEGAWRALGDMIAEDC